MCVIQLSPSSFLNNSLVFDQSISDKYSVGCCVYFKQDLNILHYIPTDSFGFVLKVNGIKKHFKQQLVFPETVSHLQLAVIDCHAISIVVFFFPFLNAATSTNNIKSPLHWGQGMNAHKTQAVWMER